MPQKDYSASFSDEGFWKKITSMPGNAGCSIIKAGISLYVLLRESKVPIWAKIAIIGVLGYFICPFDVLPDFMAGIGYTDDLALMMLLLGQLYAYMNDDIQNKIQSLMPEDCRTAPIVEPTYKS
ncbi:MAG: DUF1232 domain-containing protein [Proteobacteria bacterium]|nr:DUF1232 domain-containing protein [Pseudomonadota bacterium]MBU1387139.1 DUF1232 domain-containing protein [Pseudomonadota bacterium]MBU1541544.1 DUF1232 domain-containing protein [Pseudomonadota bacterium]MBU2430255.1 DUF1232 domain-containing protein [Pseudomonadota bacterium]MBU2480050.1 DUF1232 domain-containing protein [Pseudomonadota bacterium]